MSDRRERLQEARDLVKAAMDDLADTSPDKLAPLMHQYRGILAELDALPNAAEVSDADEIAARRAARRAGAKGQARAQRS